VHLSGKKSFNHKGSQSKTQSYTKENAEVYALPETNYIIHELWWQ
jgi:hypothetical protein